MKGIEGSTLGRYELRRRIATGGMAEVYLGYDRRVRRKVAVKVLYGSNERFVRRFEREALAVGTLSHDHILPLFDFGEQRPWYYLVMPYIEGGTLRDYLFQRERLTLEEAGYFLDQIAAALQYAHEHGVVHRDVKPSNILLRADGYAYLVDFGLAKAKLETESLSHAGTMIGTPEYMAPEQSNGASDYRSDIYSLGIILYQMLTGRVPFSGDSPVAIMLKHLQTAPTPPRELNSDIPPAIETVILKALAKEPEERYQQAQELALAYRQAARQVGRTSPPILVINGQQTQGMAVEQRQIDGPLQPSSVRACIQSAQPHINIPETTMPLSRVLPSLPAHPALQERRTIVWKGLLVGLCLLLLGTSITFGFLWRTQTAPGSTPSRHSAFSPPAAATATAQARLQASLAAQARAQATASITSDIGAGNKLFADDLMTPGNGWLNDGSQCYFTPQGYHVSTNLTHGAAWCYSNIRRFSNVVIVSQGQLIRGDFYGLIFRLSSRTHEFYALELNYKGEFRLVRARGSNPTNWLTLIDWTRTTAIQPGYRHINTLLVVCSDSHFRIYINRQLVVPDILDTAYAAGSLGFLVGGDSRGGKEAVFTNILVFQR
ncbi:MAG: serine/threonine protein kinase [Ktedonobacteraceae bacterium]|nr:serine/threonine protein kinase [Ktedonobacteraceae bacterium]